MERALGSATQPEQGSTSARRELLIAWVHLAVLWTFAFAKPLFDVLADSPEFFVARGNTRADIVLFAVAMVTLPPTVLVLVEALLLRLPRVRRAVHLLFVAGLAGAFAIQLLEDLMGGSGELLVALAGLAGVGAALLYWRTRAAPAVLTVLGPAPLLFLLIFLFLSPVSELVLPQDAEEAAKANVASATPVVMVVFDELDGNMLLDARQRIDRTRYPNFAALARDATFYRNATSVTDHTLAAVPAALSGRRPPPGSLPVPAYYPNNVFTLLGDSHELEVIETATELCPERLCGARFREDLGSRLRLLASDLSVVSLHLIAPEGLDSHLPAVGRTFADFRGGGRDAPGGLAAGNLALPSEFFKNRTQPFEALLNGIRDTGKRPSFHFLHSALPHVPWQYLPSGQQYLVNGPDSPGLEEETWSHDPLLPLQGLQRHMLQVGYVDRLVGRLTGRLRAAGLYDRALIVLTADHGASYRSGQPRREITRATVTDIASVPLLIKYPGQQRGRIEDGAARTVDVVPTIADQLRARLPWKAHGRSLLRGSLPSDRVVRVSSTTTGGAVSLSFEAFKRERRSALRRMIRLFGSNDFGRGLYATGPASDLLDSSIAAAAVADSPDARVELDAAEAYGRVRPDARVLPALVSGRIIGDVAERAPLAIALNGRVRAVTTSFAHEGELRFAAMVAPQSFRDGPNTIDVFTIEGPPGARRLDRLPLERLERYRLVERDGASLVLGEGGATKIEGARVRGFVETLERDDSGIRVAGWAADVDSHRPATRILVFEGSRLVTQGSPTMIRRDVAKQLKDPAVAKSGFQLRASADEVDLSELRIVALAGDVGSDLPQNDP